MASFIKRLLDRFKRQESTGRRSRQQRNRKLKLETMENRQLLAGDLGSIGGNVFTDLTENGLSGDDTDLANVTVWLYRDGAGTPGVGAFQSGGGVVGGNDVLVATQTTNASGDYLFDDLGPGRYFVEQAPATGRLQRSTETVKTVDISDAQSEGTAVRTIDNFTDNTAAIIANTGTPTASATTATTGTNTVGDERDVVVNHSSGANNVEAQVNGGLLSINTGAGTNGNAIITYDGVDGDANTLDHTNLTLNLTANGAQAFQFLAGSVIAGGTLTIDVFSGAGNHSSRTINIPVTAGGAANEVVIERFSDFTTASGTGANFANVTALRFQVNLNAANDAQFDLTQTVAPFLSTQNFANLNPMSIGDRVWLDVDNNGLLDAGENGIANVALQLYTDTNSSGAFENGVDTLVDSTTTNGTGNYLFDDLLPGNYLVVIPLANFGAGQPLVGHTASTGLNPVPAPNTDTNDNNNGVFLAGVGVVTTGALTLTAGGEPDGVGGNANNRLDFGFAPQIDLAIEKTVNAATITAGQQVTYTLQVTNNGPGTAEDVVVVDNLPNFMTIVSVTANPDGTVNQTNDPNGEVEVTYASLASGATRTITIVASVPASQAAAAVVTNSATVSGDGIETTTANNTDTVDIALIRNAVLQITKTDTPDPTTVGQPLNYQIIVSNTGPSTATNVVILDTLPAGLTFGTVTSSVGTATHNNGQITVNNIPTLNVGSQITVDITTTVQNNFAGTTIANSATADADEAALVTANTSTNINPRVDLTITKADSVDPVNRGGTLTYTMVVTNNGPGAANNVEVVDTLPADVTFVSATGGTVTPPSGGNNTVTVNVGNIPNGEQRTVTISVNVAQTAAALLTNSAIVRSTETTAGFDPNPGNNSDTETTATQSTIDLAITKTDSSGGNPIAPGQTVTYTLNATNNGPTNATGVRVVDNVPDGIQVSQVTSNVQGVTITTPPSAQDTNPTNNDDITFDIGNLANGASVQLTIVATVLAATRGNVTNTAVISTTTAGLLETITANNTANVITTLTPRVDVAVTKTDTVSGTVIAGNAFTYHIDVTNNGPSAATGVTVSDTLPTGVTFVSVTSAQGTASHANGLITANIGNLAPSQTVRVTVNARANADARGTLVNTATVTQTETDSNTANNTSTVNTTINPSIDLRVAKTKVNPNDPAVPGGAMTYTILVTNDGPSAATNVVMTDVLPNGLTFGSGSSTVGTVTNVGQTVTANIGSLGAGGSATVTLQVNVAGSAAGTIANTASVTGTETDSNTANNSSTLNTNVAVRGSITGRTYVDANLNGIFDTGERGLSGVSMSLTGTDILGNAVTRTATTDANGEYLFNDLVPGTYTVTQTQPQGFRSRQSNVGTPAGGTAGENTISAIGLTSGVNATAYNFGEIPNPLSKRRFLASSTEFD